MKKLVKIRLINWHYLSNELIEVEGNTILSGPNASGKSTIMDAIAFILTAGDTNFNLAANDKGKRDLRGYIKCKLGMDDREYMRNGDVSGHIALEFYDEKTEKSFAVGAVIDAFGEVLPVKSIFYRTYGPIDDSMFISEDKKIYGTVEFRKHNPEFEYYLTKKEAKRGFRTAFGSINEDFYRLIPKALAFKPISDVKEFIYQNILEEKEIDVTAIQDSIRAYKELEETLKLINKKIDDLKNIDAFYQELLQIQERKNYIDYLMKLFSVEELKSEILNHKLQIEKQEQLKINREKDINNLESEIAALNDRSKDLYNLLISDDGFKAKEYLNREIVKTQNSLAALEGAKQIFLKRVTAFKDNVTEIRKLTEEKLFGEMANLSLVKITPTDVEATKLLLSDYQKRLIVVQGEYNQKLGSLNRQKQALLKEIEEISDNIRSLKENRLNFNPQLMRLRSELEENLKILTGYNVRVHFVAELCEITDRNWADTIEIFMGNRRFNMIVDPRYFDQALNIYGRIHRRYSIYGIGLINTQKMAGFKKFAPRSLASIVTTENEDVKGYINYTLGNVIMCDTVEELKQYDRAITNDHLLYSNYAVTSLNPNVDRPFIGKSATTAQKENWETKARAKSREFNDLNSEITALNRILELSHDLPINLLMDDLDKVLTLEKHKAILDDLNRQILHHDTASPKELQKDYDHTLETIKNSEIKKTALLKEIGGIDNAIEALVSMIAEKNKNLVCLEADLKVLSKGSMLMEQKALAEYKELIKTKSFKAAYTEFHNLYRSEDQSYKTLNDSLIGAQYNYINTYNSAFSVGLTEMDKFLNELNRLEKTELIKYEQKVRSARESAETVFKEDFIAKLRDNILTAKQEIAKINETLSTITFGNDRYEFIFPISSEYSVFYEMVTSDMEAGSKGLLTYDFIQKYDKQIKELFDELAVEEINSNGAVAKLTDYRTYMDYDIRIIGRDGSTMTYSKVFKEKSGGETQVPFYVAIIASFVRVYTKTSVIGGDPIGLVLFDEVFDKMDANRMRSMMEFINSMPLQVIIACPPQRMNILEKYATTGLIMYRKGSKAGVVNTLANGVYSFTKNSKEKVEV